MTREESTIQVLKNHIEVLEENIRALEQEQKYCDRNICTSNEYNGIGCDECEVTKSREYEKEKVLDNVRAEIEMQEKWLAQAGYNAYNVEIAFNSIKLALKEMENRK